MMRSEAEIVVVGGGVVGCAVLWHLTRQGHTCVLLEKNTDLISGASSGNSGVITEGFDVDPSSVEWRCLQRARVLRAEFFRRFPVVARNPCGAIMVAFTDEELQKLSEVKEDAEKSDITCQMLSAALLRKLEPCLSRDALGGLLLPAELPFDPWLMGIVMAHSAKRLGAKVYTSAEVVSAEQGADGRWSVVTSQNHVISARVVINCAGLYGDHVDALAGYHKFRKGEYLVFDKDACKHVNHVIMPVATQHSRGVLIIPSAYGNLLVGPTAQDVPERDVQEVTKDIINNLHAYALRMFPDLREHVHVATYGGLRPATEHSDYQISVDADRNWVTVGGIRSTGASACLGIAEYVHEIIKSKLSLPLTSIPVTMETPHHLTFRVTDRGSIVIEEQEYRITHPIAYHGLCQSSEHGKLKAKL